MNTMTNFRRYLSIVVATVTATFVVGCGGGPDEARDWRSIDMCSLAEPHEVAQLDYSKSIDEVTQPKRSDDDTSHVCSWGEYLGISMKDRAETDHVSPYHVRDIEIDGRPAAVNYQKGGDCDVWLRYRDAELGIGVNPARSKTDIDLDDTSAISCDIQMPLLTSIVSRVDLP